MSKKSAGILAYRMRADVPEVLLVHPGGPFFAKKDEGVWSIPKGEFDDEEQPLDAARREFEEEVGLPVSGLFTELGSVKLKSGKTVFAWAVECDMDLTDFRSNTFPMEWPPKSGKFIEIPEVDKAEWLDMFTAKQKINAAQVYFLSELERMLSI